MFGPRKTDQEPVRTECGKTGGVGDYYLDHPAFGQISVGRVSGGAVLYGSDFTHQHYIRLAIHTSRMNRSLSNDRYFAGKEIIEVVMSEAQFATMISSMNQGSGAPCTISHVHGVRPPTIPPRDMRKAYRDELHEDLQGTATELEALIKNVKSMGLPKGKTAEIVAGLQRAHGTVTSSIPWVEQQFDEHMEETVEAAKSEIHGYLNEAVKTTGIQGYQAPQVLLGAAPEEGE